MNIAKEIKEMLALTNVHHKENALENINEVLEYRHGEVLNEVEIVEGVKLLLAAVLQEKDQRMKQRFLRTIFFIVVFCQGKYLRRSNIDWDSLVASLSLLEQPQLEYALDILGISGREQYIPVLNGYTQHSDPEIKKRALKGIDNIKLAVAYDAQNEG